MIFAHLNWLWMLAPLVAVPLIIHLLNRRYPRLLRFPDIENIRKAVAQRSKLFRFRHWIMLAIRTMALLILLWVFLKPLQGVFGSALEKSGQRHVLIIYDHSLSMGYKGGSMSSARRGMVEVEKIVEKLAPEDRVNLIVSGRVATSCFPDFSLHHREIAAFVKRLPPGLTKADFNKSLAVAGRMAAKADGRLDVYMVSDFQRRNWADVRFDALPESARVFFVDVSAKIRNNRGIQGARMLDPNVLVGEPARLEVTIGNYSDAAFDDTIEVLVNDTFSTRTEVRVRPWSVARINVAVTLRHAGVHTIKVALPEDNLLEDNEWYLSVPVRDKEEVVILTDESELDHRATYFLKTALNPYTDNAGSLLPKIVNTASFSAIDLAGSKKMFISRVNKLSPEACEVLARFLNEGGGIVYFLDGSAPHRLQEKACLPD